ncbi:hypothetical protein HJV68_11665 [Intestinimonas butyriciproducens]|nr:hypothetical protein [Intestinimonas butyriciproducens]
MKNSRKIGLDHSGAHRHEKLAFFFSAWYHAGKTEYPGEAQLVARLLWENTPSRIKQLNNRV